MIYKNIEITKFEPGSDPMKVENNPEMEIFEGLHTFIRITGR